jgi:hypothetical protein
MLLHAADQVLIVLQSFGAQEIGEASQFGQRHVAVLSVSGAAIGRLVARVGVLRPYDFTVAVAGRWEAGASERCTDDRCMVSPDR